MAKREKRIFSYRRLLKNNINMSDFYKYHGLGNDYIVVDPSKSKIPMTKSNIKLICHRNFGIGSDGILYGPIKDNRKIRLQIFNPDGSEAEKSGNGIRIFAQYLWDCGYIKEDSFELETKSGTVTVYQLDKKKSLIKVDMGKYTFTSKDIPTNSKNEHSFNETISIEGKDLKVSCVSIGNPHCVILTEKVTPEITKKYGPHIETHKLFPNKTNVQFLQIIDRDNIKIEIWERGAGYTLASGSSSVAAACVSHKKGLINSEVIVHMSGGNVKVNIENERAFLTGVVSRVMEGTFAKELTT